MHTTICRMLLTLQSSTLVLPNSWTPRVRIPAVSALKGSFLPPLHVKAHLCGSFLCPRAAGCCWFTWWYRQRGRERMWDVSSSKLSSSSTRALNPVCIYCHLTSLLAWPCVHKVIPVRGFLFRRREAEELQPVLQWECVCSQCWSKSLLCHSAGVMCLGKFLLACFPVPQNCCRRGNILFSTCISQSHLDRHRFEFLSPNADTALRLSINSSSANSYRHQRSYLAMHKLWQSLELDCKAQRPQALAPVHTTARTSAKLLNLLFIRTPTLGAELPLNPSLTPKHILGALWAVSVTLAASACWDNSCLVCRYQCWSPWWKVNHHLCGDILPLLLQDESFGCWRKTYWKGLPI